jgi:hypothetical protein
VSPRPRAIGGQALVDYVLVLSGVVIVCIVVLAAIGQAIPWSTVVDGFNLLR